MFLRPSNGVYLPPQFLQLNGKSTIVPIDVLASDMPNFFVEAVTISDGRVHTEVSEIHVPPAKRILNVDVVPSADAYQPGQPAKVKLKLTDEPGMPFVGSTVLSIYDKSVEYISGGSNVPNIKDFFWKWLRHHQPYDESSLTAGPSTSRCPAKRPSKASACSATRWPTIRRSHQAAGIWSRGRNGRWRQSLPGAPVVAQHGGAGCGADDGRSQGRSIFRRQVDRPVRDAAEALPRHPTSTHLRQEFADTALWVASLETNSDGLAEVSLDMPENLTTWKIQVWAMGHGTRVGQASTEVVTRKNIIVRMQAPRFFVESDEVVLSANVHNYLPDAKQVKVRLEQTASDRIAGRRGANRRNPGRRRAARRLAREGCSTRARPCSACWRLTDVESDAVEMQLPVYVHGMLKMDSYTGMLRPMTNAARSKSSCPASGAPKRPGWKCATRPRWPARWSTPCPTWSTIPTAAPSRRSTASCRP